MLQVVFASAERRLADRNHRPAGSLVYANDAKQGYQPAPRPQGITRRVIVDTRTPGWIGWVEPSAGFVVYSERRSFFASKSMVWSVLPND